MTHSITVAKLESLTLPQNLCDWASMRLILRFAFKYHYSSRSDQLRVGCIRFLHRPHDIEADPQNAFYSSLDGVLLDKSQTTVALFPSGRGPDYTVPPGINKLASAHFPVVPGSRASLFRLAHPALDTFAFFSSGITTSPFPTA